MTDAATDDLATTTDDEVADTTTAADAKGGTDAKGAEAGKGDQAAADKGGAADKSAQPSGEGADKGKSKTIASGGDVDADDEAKAADKAAKDKPYWPADWREKAAEHLAAGDKKVYDKELKRLQRITDPAGMYGMYRELDNRLNGGGLVKVPGKDAKPEEVAAFAKALGWAEKPEEMLGHIKLESGAVLGDADKPVVTSFLQAINGATSAQDMINRAVNWNFKQQEEKAAALDEADDTFQRESLAALKGEWGPAFKRKINAMGSVFAMAEGGADPNNPNSFMSQLATARFPNGQIVGNSPAYLKWVDAIVNEINPAASLVESGNQSGVSLDQELANIDKFRRENRPAYNKDHKMQARERELLEARNKIQARQRA